MRRDGVSSRSIESNELSNGVIAFSRCGRPSSLEGELSSVEWLRPFGGFGEFRICRSTIAGEAHLLSGRRNVAITEFRGELILDGRGAAAFAIGSSLPSSGELSVFC